MKSWIALLFAAASLASIATGAGTPPDYNVLFLMTDEHNARIMGCAGDPVVKTPTLDALAARGVRFSAAYCQNPICVPSRVSLVSGRMASNVGVFQNSASATMKYENITTLADVFGQAGYRTAWFGKTHWGNPRFQNTDGRDRPDFEKKEKSLGRLPQQSAVSTWPVEQNTDHGTAEDALAFLEKNRDRKFFAGVSFIKPHFPFTIQPKYHDLYKGRLGLPRAPEKLIAELPAISKRERETYKHAEASADEIIRSRELYYGMVTYADEEFGRILRRLDELGLREKTIIVYTADHGEMLGERGIWYKNSFYEGSVAIPFIWSFPRALPQGKVVSAPVMNMDVFPTLVELCGLARPAGLEGSSLMPLMTGRDDGQGRIALSENYRGNFAGRMIRTPEWKYVFYTNGEHFLYHMQNDPREETNLVADPKYRGLVDDLHRRAADGWVVPQRGVREVAGLPGSSNDAPAKRARKKND